MSLDSSSESFVFQKIGEVHSPFPSKFGVPRQPNLTPSIVTKIKFKDDFRIQTALKGMEAFSHIWVIFVFHKHGAKDWKATVRPPRLGGSQKMGSLASRSPHRPNPIGMSVFPVLAWNFEAKGGVEVSLEGGDLVNGTPVLDVKPYISYTDSVEEASLGWAQKPIEKFEVRFADGVGENFKSLLSSLPQYGVESFDSLREQISEVLSLDPRPAFQKTKNALSESSNEGRVYGFDLGAFDVHYRLSQGAFEVFEIVLKDESFGPVKSK
ncbi:MAG TPA: tRNA (N6-threonylcarbamoyladenosine(37)-N6)-methyltransferase TrmO [Bdellovibrionales bacterium]|nr:tRNA (N6-threonylcarbamoyladenosine(37)-N6)-methyltransferase TrmO [Pseudobdellovibrionaceae bacterium]HAG92244.1 tRNA (N6-threonylcarbamoyladenosine(37)-N6)-methyltransferase TrmO [Bdellovibrionales bacterium]|tara:strand:- start:274 stop:1074 length:801 start_codon:yes stop_codon:yes gene_type:complete